MANPRRSSLNASNVFDIAEARKKKNTIDGLSGSDQSTSLSSLAKSDDSGGAGKTEDQALDHNLEVDELSKSLLQESNSDSNPPESGKSGTITVRNRAATKPASKAKTGNRTYNAAKVKAIKEAIANGTYVINPQRVADKFIEQEAKL